MYRHLLLPQKIAERRIGFKTAKTVQFINVFRRQETRGLFFPLFIEKRKFQGIVLSLQSARIKKVLLHLPNVGVLVFV